MTKHQSMALTIYFLLALHSIHLLSPLYIDPLFLSFYSSSYIPFSSSSIYSALSSFSLSFSPPPILLRFISLSASSFFSTTPPYHVPPFPSPLILILFLFLITSTSSFSSVTPHYPLIIPLLLLL